MDKKVFNVERGLISKLVETKDMSIIKDHKIKPHLFIGENKKVFNFILESFKANGEVPTGRIIKQKFPNYILENHEVNGKKKYGTEESLIYWCTAIREKAKHNTMAELTEEIAQKLNCGETEEAYALLKRGVWKIEDEIVEKSSVDITKDTEERKQAYLNKKKSHGMVGISTGIKQLDYLMGGLVDETLTTLIATSGVGKTWFLVLIGAYAMIHNYKVCMFVTEMSTQLMQDRFEVMLYSMLCGNIDYGKFKRGFLSSQDEEKFFNFLGKKLPKLTPLIIENATGVSSVVSVIEREKPDLVLIDGVYLMEDEQNAKDDWLRVAHITRDLKKTAKNWHLPIVINTQADKNTSKKTGPELGSIMYTQSVGQDSDNVLALFRDEVMVNDKEMGVKILKQREGTLGKVFMQWDFSTMKFDGIYSEGGENNTEDTEDTEDNGTFSIE